MKDKLLPIELATCTASFREHSKSIIILVLAILVQGYFLNGNTNWLAYAQQEHQHEEFTFKCKPDATGLIPGLGGLDAQCGEVNEVVEHPGAQVYIDNVVYFDSYTDILGKHSATPGNKFVSVDVTLKNTGNNTLYQDPLAYALFFPSMAYWEDKMRTNSSKDCGYLSCSFVITSRAATRDTIPAVIQPGDAIRGTAYFEVPATERDFTFLYQIPSLRNSKTDLGKVAVFDLSANKFPPDERPSSDSAPSSDIEAGLSSSNGVIQIMIDSKRTQNSVEAGGNTFTAPEDWTAYVLELSLTNNGDTNLSLNETRMYLRDANDYGFIAFPVEQSGTKESRNIAVAAGESAKITVASFVPEGSNYFTLVYFDGVKSGGKIGTNNNVIVVPEFPATIMMLLTSGLILLAVISITRFYSKNLAVQ